MICLVVNPRSGSSDDATLEQIAADLDDCTVVEVGDDVELPTGTTELAVSGGDGTVSWAAAQAAARRLPLVVIPSGTRNHFASDLGIASPDEAVAAWRGGRTRAVDLGEIDGHVFVNNASLGAYPELVDVRERFEGRLGRRLALLVALVVVLRRGSPYRVSVDGRHRRVWLAWFGNCRYDLPGLVAGGRSDLGDGLLDVRLVHADRKFARLRLIASIVLRRLDHCTVYEHAEAARVTVRVLDGGPVRIAADGETFDARDVFVIAKRPSVLEVFVDGTDDDPPAAGSVAMAVEEPEDRLVEDLVAVTGDHVTGTGDIGVLGVGNPSEEVAGALLAEQVALPAPHEQRGHP